MNTKVEFGGMAGGDPLGPYLKQKINKFLMQTNVIVNLGIF